MSSKKRCRSMDSSSPSDAFAVMMQKGVKRQEAPSYSRTITSAFVLCPAGCGKSFLERAINSHLDECLAHVSSLSTTTTTTTPENSQIALPCDAISPCSDDKTNHDKAQNNDKALQGDNDAFSLMLQHARQTFSQKESTLSSAGRFHLHSDGNLSWEATSASNQSHINELDIQWSASVSLKQIISSDTVTASNSSERRELIVSSSIPSLDTSAATSPQRSRLVRRHSRLSVPVLKSILQKAIRRRRPLPAAKVAMELADKSLGDLLRRLPIIVLEDSTLHPDLPLLSWLMVAHSKEYVPPRQLIIRVIQIVYEIASCPWTDCLTTQNDFDQSIPLGESQPVNDEVTKGETILRSLVLRASYGGMSGDVKMLIDYNQLWRDRFVQSAVPIDMSAALKAAHASVSDDSSSANNNNQLTWCQVPELIHRRGKQQSENHVTVLVKTGIDKLGYTDICVEGIDFHCSSVLDYILADDNLVNSLYEHLAKLQGLHPPAAKHLRRSWLEGTLKKCMWNYSSGVNHRRPLGNSTLKNRSTNAPEDPLKTIWDNIVSPRARHFMNKYIQERLS